MNPDLTDHDLHAISTWNYRLVQHDGYAEVVEAYYGDDGTIYGWCAAGPLASDDPDELREDIESMLSAWLLPTIDCADLPDEPHTHGDTN